MNLPFPSLNPRLVYYRWFSDDSNLDDEEFELAAIELENQIRFNRISMRYTRHTIIGQPDPDSVDGDNTAVVEDGAGEHFEVEEASPRSEIVADNEIVEEEENSDDYEDIEEEEVLSRSLDALDSLIDHESSEATSHWSSLR